MNLPCDLPFPDHMLRDKNIVFTQMIALVSFFKKTTQDAWDLFKHRMFESFNVINVLLTMRTRTPALSSPQAHVIQGLQCSSLFGGFYDLVGSRKLLDLSFEFTEPG